MMMSDDGAELVRTSNDNESAAGLLDIDEETVLRFPPKMANRRERSCTVIMRVEALEPCLLVGVNVGRCNNGGKINVWATRVTPGRT